MSVIYRTRTPCTVSSETIANWYAYCREMCVIALDADYEDEGLIGCDGHLVEVDEMKLGRRKFHRGRIVEGSWIFGMIDRDTKAFRLEICPDNKRDKYTLMRMIMKHVEPGVVCCNKNKICQEARRRVASS
ncbi:unnamed protein product [Bemisia tabaci]|uniref:Transposase n=1 Tax=Bemisia tabaci TaxID=7038 RepID=A0A9P0F546_BEMTA|nr:unnamed protein product [Bemisia tabaci]